MAQVIPIPALNDNYIWLIKGMPSNAAVVDPGDAKPVLEYLSHHNIELSYILITHHHWDHTNGIHELLATYPDAQVHGPANEEVAHITTKHREGDTFELDGIGTFHVLDIPGHTLGHIAYYTDESLFCGDTLFLCGCGRVFEGTPPQMHESLSKLKALSDDLDVYCGHEYTEANLSFCLHVEPDNVQLKERLEHVKSLRAQNKPSVPAKLGLEKQTNPFLRCDTKSIATAVLAHSQTSDDSAAAVFTHLRAWKDTF